MSGGRERLQGARWDLIGTRRKWWRILRCWGGFPRLVADLASLYSLETHCPSYSDYQAHFACRGVGFLEVAPSNQLWRSLLYSPAPSLANHTFCDSIFAGISWRVYLIDSLARIGKWAACLWDKYPCSSGPCPCSWRSWSSWRGGRRGSPRKHPPLCVSWSCYSSWRGCGCCSRCFLCAYWHHYGFFDFENQMIGGIAAPMTLCYLK